ncbi:MAG: YggU family protein [Myxococcales bacterium]|nr:YggU family protein [Myxococcales bacterium]MBK7198237.1 YggU family protein [Myxococcales bacterium]
MSWLRATADGVALDVLVQPRASRPKLGPIHGDRIKVAVTAPPVDGEANAAVIELVAKALGVARGAVAVTAGQASRRKTLAIRGVDLARVTAVVEAA